MSVSFLGGFFLISILSSIGFSPLSLFFSLVSFVKSNFDSGSQHPLSLNNQLSLLLNIQLSNYSQVESRNKPSKNMKQNTPLHMPVMAHPDGLGQSNRSPDEPDTPSSSQQVTDPDPMIPEQDLAPIRARVLEYINCHTRQTQHVYYSSFPSSSPSNDDGGELHQTVSMLRRAQRINSELWFVQRSLMDEKKGVTRSQLQTELLPKLDACAKELAFQLRGGRLRRGSSLSLRRGSRDLKRGSQVPPTSRRKAKTDSMMWSALTLAKSFVPFSFRRPALLRGRR